MKSKILALRLSGTIFGLVAMAHVLRLISGLPVLLGDWLLPLWVNGVGAVAGAALCIWLWVASKQL